MVVKDDSSELSAQSIMEGLENTSGIRLHNHRRKLKQRFDIVKKLGQGTYGKVQLGINKETGQEVAIKTIKKAKIETEADLIRIRREIQIMSSVRHPNIIHIYEVFENREKMVLVMEYASGGELYDYLSEKKVLTEDEARRIFRQISCAVYYCHKHKICHRDLKLENILLDEKGNAKIADFGLSNVFDEHHLLTTFCGSPLYASPEIVRGTPYYGPEVDCWSLGVLLYTLVYGAMPFDGSNFKRLVKQISQGDYYEPKKVSPASPLIHHMLTVTPAKRANVENISSHWWVNEGYSESCLEIAEDLANQTPVRLDLLLSLAPQPASGGDQVVVPKAEDLKVPPVLTDETRDMMNEYLNNNNTDLVLRSQSEGSLMDVDHSLTGKSEEKDSTSNKRKLEDSFSGSAAFIGKTNNLKKKEGVDKSSRGVRKKTCAPHKSKSSPGLEPMEVETERTVLPSDTLSGVNELETELAAEAQDNEPCECKEQRRKSSIPLQDEGAKPKGLKIKSKSPPEVADTAVPNESKVSPPAVEAAQDKSPLKEKSPVPNAAAAADTSVVKPEGEGDTSTIKKVRKVKKKVKKDESKPEAKETAEKENVPQQSKCEPEKIAPAVSAEAVAPAQSEPTKETVVVEVKATEEKKDKVEKAKERKESPPKAPKPAAEPVPPVARRNSNIAKTAEIFKNLSSRTVEPKTPPADKPRKIVLPGLVSDAKKAFECAKQPEKKAVSLPGVKVSDAKRAFEVKKTVSKGSSLEKNETPSPLKEETADPMAAAAKSVEQPEPTPAPEAPKQPEPKKEEETKLVPALKQSDKGQDEAKVRKLKEVGKLQLSGAPPAELAEEGQKFKPVVLDTGSGAPRSAAMLVRGPTTPPSSTPSSASASPQKKAAFFPPSGKFATKSRSNTAVPEGKGTQPTEETLEKASAPQAVPKEGSTSPVKQVPKPLIRNKSEEQQAEEKAGCDGTENSYVKNLSKSKLNRREPSVGRDEPVATPPLPPQPDSPRKKAAVEIVLSGSQNRVGGKAATLPRRSSKAEMVVNGLPPPAPSAASNNFKTEIEHHVGGEKPMQRTEVSFSVGAPETDGKRERIIPIRVEKEVTPAPPEPTPAPTASMSRQSTLDSDTESLSSPHLEPIRKSPREYIIPILVEGGGCVTPKEDISETTEGDGFRTDSRLRRGRFSRSKKLSLLTDGGGSVSEDDANSPYATYQRHQSVGKEDGEEDNQEYGMHRLRSSRPSGHQYPLDHSDSFSSAEEDDDDGFEILTAESLFSTLLARVRSLTRRLNRDEPSSVLSSRRYSSRQSSVNGGGETPTPGEGFWSPSSTTYGREAPAPWRRRKTSRESYDGDSYSGIGSVSTSSTLPRAGTATYSARSEAADSDASSDTSSSYPAYTPSLSRRLSHRLSTTSLPSRRNGDDAGSVRSEPDGKNNSRMSWHRSQSDNHDGYSNSTSSIRNDETYPGGRRREYGRALSSLELGQDRSLFSRMASGDYLGTYATLRSPLTSGTTTSGRTRSQSVMDSGVEDSRGWVVGGRNITRTFSTSSSSPRTPTMYETSFVSGQQPRSSDSVIRLSLGKSGFTSGVGSSRYQRASSESHGDHFGVEDERKMRAASECRYGGSRSVVGGRIAMFDSRETSPAVVTGASTLPRLRDLQTQSLMGLKREDDAEVEEKRRDAERLQQKIEQAAEKTAAAERAAAEKAAAEKAAAEKAAAEKLPKGTLKMRPDVVIRKKLTPLVEAAKVPDPPEEPQPKPKTGLNMVNSILNRFKKFEEARKAPPPVAPRFRRAQSVYCGAVSDGILTGPNEQPRPTEPKPNEEPKSAGQKYTRRAATMEFNMNTEDSKKKVLVADKMKDILKEPRPSNNLSRSVTDANVKPNLMASDNSSCKKTDKKIDIAPKPRRDRAEELSDLALDLRSGEAAQRRRMRAPEAVEPRFDNHLLDASESIQEATDDSPRTPSDSVDSMSMCSDNLDRSSLLDEEESVSERIRRKSFFSRFNEPARRNKSKQRRTSKEFSDHLTRPRLHLGDTPGQSSPTPSYNGDHRSHRRSREDREWSLPPTRYHGDEDTIFATIRREPRRKVSVYGPPLIEGQEFQYQNGGMIPEEDVTETSDREATTPEVKQQKSYSTRRQSSSRLGALLSQLQTGEEDHTPKRSSLLETGLLSSRDPLGRRTNRYSSYLDPDVSLSSYRSPLGGFTSPTYMSSTLPRPSSSFLDRSWRSGSVAEEGPFFRQ